MIIHIGYVGYGGGVAFETGNKIPSLSYLFAIFYCGFIGHLHANKYAEAQNLNEIMHATK